VYVGVTRRRGRAGRAPRAPDRAPPRRGGLHVVLEIDGK
jgi:hypothetical protein